MSPKLLNNFDRLSEAELIMRVGLIIAALTGNAHFPEPWHRNVATLAALIAAFEAYRVAVQAAMMSHDPLKIGQRDQARQTLTTMLKQLAPYLELEANGDRAILASTGFELRQDAVHGSTSGTLPAPGGFRVTQGAKSGTLDVHVARQANAGSYEVQLTQGDPSVEANWRHAMVSTSGAHMLLEGLPRGQIFWVRVRAHGAGGAGVWTDPISVVVT